MIGAESSCELDHEPHEELNVKIPDEHARKITRRQSPESSANPVPLSLVPSVPASTKLLRLLPALGPPVSLQNLLAQAQRLRRNLHEFIVCNKLDRLFQVERLVWNQANGVVCARRA